MDKKLGHVIGHESESFDHIVHAKGYVNFACGIAGR